MAKDVPDISTAARKEKLIADGALYRVELVRAKVHVTHSLRPDALWNGVLTQVLGLATGRVQQLFAPGGLRIQTVMPYVLAGFSLIARKKMIKPALGIGAVAVLALVWLVRKRQ